MQISVVVIVKNGEKYIARCLESAKSFSDDLVVVIDNLTTDATAAIASACGARVFFRDFDGYTGQKNYANSLAIHDWILSLDVDETASLGLAAAIRSLPAIPLYPAYSLPRKNKIFGRYIAHTNWDPNGMIRLFDRRHCRWQGDIHEQIVTEGAVGRLYDGILHDNYQTVDQFIARQDIYSSARANELYLNGVRFSFVRLIGAPVYDFLRRFVLHAGFLDGWHGLFLSYLMAYYHLSVWIKLWLKYHPVSS
jgi:glycosyltransferase involved in cell wall biosynthesis